MLRFLSTKYRRPPSIGLPDSPLRPSCASIGCVRFSGSLLAPVRRVPVPRFVVWPFPRERIAILGFVSPFAFGSFPISLESVDILR